jgi:GH35 family endo-1,4-beta-xylanase
MRHSSRPRAGGRRRMRATALAAAALAGAVFAPAVTHAQQQPFPKFPQDKFLGSISEFNRPLFTQYFNQVTPENGGKWGVAAGTTRTAAMRWGQLDTAYNFAMANGFKFNFHVLVWGNQQPTWMVNLPPEEQLLELHKWFAAVAERYPNIEWLQVVNEPTWDPPDGSIPKNAGSNFNSSGNYIQALGGYNGTDGTGHDWILNAFRMAKHYFPNTKLMINDVAITGMTEATDEYLEIINILKEEDLIDTIGLQAHAFEFIHNNPNVPSIPGHPYVPVDDMSIHKANLDRLAATGLPIQITELDLDGYAVDGVPGDEMQLSYYRNVFPTFWEHPAVEGVTLWGWRQPSHWRNAQGAPIVLSNDTPKPAALWLYNYVRGIAPKITEDQSFTVTDAHAESIGTVEATDWASDINRPHLRTFTWSITDGNDDGIFEIEPSTGVLKVAKPGLLNEHTTYTLELRVNDGHHTSDPQEVTVQTGELSNVDETTVGGSVPATLALEIGSAGFGAFIPGVAQDYEASTSASITSTAGDATLTVVDPSANVPGHLVNGDYSLAQPVHAAGSGDFLPIGSTPQVLHTYDNPVSNDSLTVRFKQSIGATDALRTGTYSKTFTFTLSTTTP